MSKNKKPHPAGGTAEQGKRENSHNTNFTMNSPEAQGRIFSLLLEGEENAISAPELARLVGYRSTRSLRAEIDREREQYGSFLILASEAGYYRPASGNRGIVEIRRFLWRQDARAASNRRTTRLIRARLRALEKSPLDGQESLFNGGDD